MFWIHIVIVLIYHELFIQGLGFAKLILKVLFLDNESNYTSKSWSHCGCQMRIIQVDNWSFYML